MPTSPPWPRLAAPRRRGCVPRCAAISRTSSRVPCARTPPSATRPCRRSPKTCGAIASTSRRAHLQIILAELYGIAVHARRAEALLVRARSGASEAGDPALLSRVECNLAFRHGMNGAIDQARPLFEAAVARLRTMQDPDRGAL